MDFLKKEYIKKINSDKKRLKEIKSNFLKNEKEIYKKLLEFEQIEKNYLKKYNTFKTLFFFEKTKENLKENITFKKIIKIINLFYTDFIFDLSSKLKEKNFLSQNDSEYDYLSEISETIDEIFELIFGILKNDKQNEKYFEILKEEYILKLKNQEKNINEINEISCEINFIEYKNIDYFFNKKFNNLNDEKKFKEIIKYYFFIQEDQNYTKIFNKKNSEKIKNILLLFLDNYKKKFLEIENVFFEINSYEIITSIETLNKISLIKSFDLLERKKEK